MVAMMKPAIRRRHVAERIPRRALHNGRHHHVRNQPSQENCFLPVSKSGSEDEPAFMIEEPDGGGGDGTTTGTVNEGDQRSVT